MIMMVAQPTTDARGAPLAQSGATSLSATNFNVTTHQRTWLSWLFRARFLRQMRPRPDARVAWATFTPAVHTVGLGLLSGML